MTDQRDGTVREPSTGDDPIPAFYDRHPYPPPVVDARTWRRTATQPQAERAAHHVIWPRRRPTSIRSVLIAGCGTSQAVRHALRHRSARVVGIDVSATSIEHTRALAARSDVDNLELHRLPIEAVADLGEQFDHIVCTGVLHHLRAPELGLRRLRDVLAPGGAVTLMVYARYGRVGVAMFQEYCRKLGVSSDGDELADLVATLREVPLGHPIGRLLRETRDFADDDALADALCNPRERSYTVPELLDLVHGAGLDLARWERQAPYLPDCGSLSETPHGRRIGERSPSEQYALVELFRGTIARHTAILYAADDPTARAAVAVDFSAPDAGTWVPVPLPTARAVEERLPPGYAAALLNRAHSDTDLVLFADRSEYDIFRAIDGSRRIDDLGPLAPGFVERLWRHDLVALDMTGDAP